MSGTIILIDGPAGCGKTTVLCGMPEARALYDTDVDGARWTRNYFAKYENSRDVATARKTLMAWADDKELRSIAVDVWAYFWQITAQQVLEGGGNTFRAWGPAKMAMRRLHDALIRAKRAGKQVALTAHTKDAFQVDDDGGRTSITKTGQKADTEAMLNDLLDVHLRMGVDLKRDTRWFEVVKCRPQREFKALLPAKLEVPRGESQLMYGRILAAIGEAPETLASEANSDSEDNAAQAAMKAAAAAGGR